jgi:hypothetical protein
MIFPQTGDRRPTQTCNLPPSAAAETAVNAPVRARKTSIPTCEVATGFPVEQITLGRPQTSPARRQNCGAGAVRTAEPLQYVGAQRWDGASSAAARHWNTNVLCTLPVGDASL